MKRNCDVVMKGGIASGVVYPKAIVRLSEEFRLRNVGGTSAGAIAAAAAAAAQYGENHDQGGGFRRLGGLSNELKTRLKTLFQPSATTKPLFEVLMAATESEKGWRAKTVAIVKASIKSFWTWGAVGLVPGVVFVAVALLSAAQWWAVASAALAGGLIAVAVAAVGIVIAAVRNGMALPDNYYGLCTGHVRDAPDQGNPPLTSWLADEIDELAGTKDRDKPLTFADLWGTDDPEAPRDIDLQMLTTSLTHGAAYSLPFEGSGRWWFSPEQFRDLFPTRIVDWMERVAPEPDPGREGPFDGLRRLPRAGDMPVVVAARMSLSFPVLISAVPLHTVDRGRKERVEESHRAREARKAGRPLPRGPQWPPEQCWFSDGGITSNFPIQFFDSPVPRWPTFGINLREFGRGWTRDPADESKNIDMPKHNRDGRMEPWTSWEEESRSKKLFAFLGSVFETSRSWMDNAQMRVPGYRDRVVHIGREKDEGGMNLAMDPKVIERLSLRGEEAASELISRFGVPPMTEFSLTWDNQRWIRYRAYMTELEDALARLRRGCMEPLDDDRSIRQLSGRTKSEPPEAARWKVEPPQREFADEITEMLTDLAEHWQESGKSFEPGSPRPRPQLRLTPRL